MIKNEFIQRVYDTMIGALAAGQGVPDVEDAYTEGEKCDKRYSQIYDAERRLEARLGLFEEDEDVSEIIHCMMDIREELCCRMYCYGAKFGMRE